jgi:hypothetical protein
MCILLAWLATAAADVPSAPVAVGQRIDNREITAITGVDTYPDGSVGYLLQFSDGEQWVRSDGTTVARSGDLPVRGLGDGRGGTPGGHYATAWDYSLTTHQTVLRAGQLHPSLGILWGFEQPQVALDGGVSVLVGHTALGDASGRWSVVYSADGGLLFPETLLTQGATFGAAVWSGRLRAHRVTEGGGHFMALVELDDPSGPVDALIVDGSVVLREGDATSRGTVTELVDADLNVHGTWIAAAETSGGAVVLVDGVPSLQSGDTSEWDPDDDAFWFDVTRPVSVGINRHGETMQQWRFNAFGNNPGWQVLATCPGERTSLRAETTAPPTTGPGRFRIGDNGALGATLTTGCCRDTDGDGLCAADDLCEGDNASGDTDGDGLCDDLDPCITWAGNDADGDGTCDDLDLCVGDDATGDTDMDGICNDRDVCPLDPLDDEDRDGLCADVDLCLGPNIGGDSDGDGVCDGIDVCPLDPDDDADQDGLCGDVDDCLGDQTTGDADGDGLCDDRDFGLGSDVLQGGQIRLLANDVPVGSTVAAYWALAVGQEPCIGSVCGLLQAPAPVGPPVVATDDTVGFDLTLPQPLQSGTPLFLQALVELPTGEVWTSEILVRTHP